MLTDAKDLYVGLIRMKGELEKAWVIYESLYDAYKDQKIDDYELIKEAGETLDKCIEKIEQIAELLSPLLNSKKV